MLFSAIHAHAASAEYSLFFPYNLRALVLPGLHLASLEPVSQLANTKLSVTTMSTEKPPDDPNQESENFKILETIDDIQERRDTVLGKYVLFKADAKDKRTKLEDSKRFQYFKRDADELESWIYEKLQIVSEECFKDYTNLQGKIQRHQAFEAEVTAHAEAIETLDRNGLQMINNQHFASETIKVN